MAAGAAVDSGAWARAYAGEPLTRPERALALAGADLEPLTATRCSWCRRPLANVGERGQARRKYCSAKCRNAKYLLTEQ